MIITSDLLEICSLYFTQSAVMVEKHKISFLPWYDWMEQDEIKKHMLRCSMYALAARLIIEGVWY